LSFHAVHTPLQAMPDIVEQCRKRIRGLGLDGRREENQREKRYQNNANYAAMVHHMDENVGRLLARLDDLALAEDTIVVFTSDNGGKGSVTSNLPLRGAKHNLYEGGIRVPLVVRWPGHVEPGSHSPHPLISNDFYPTLLDLAGLPLEPKQHLDGVSFKPILLGERDDTDRDTRFWHYPHGRMEGAVRRGDWKLLVRYKTGEHELYNLRHDPGEQRDPAAAQPDRVAAMAAEHGN
jgi:arylsulfatase A-like enzyme